MPKAHCLCKAVSMEFDETRLNWSGHCHCESCRRNCSAPMTSFFAVENDGWQWTGEEPLTYASSKGVTRYFCGKCGTPMAYTNTKFPSETHFYAASLEKPEVYTPTAHFFYGEKLEWLPIEDDLKKHGMGGL